MSCSAGAGLSAFGGCVHETHGRARTRASGFYGCSRAATTLDGHTWPTDEFSRVECAGNVRAQKFVRSLTRPI